MKALTARPTVSAAVAPGTDPSGNDGLAFSERFRVQQSCRLRTARADGSVDRYRSHPRVSLERTFRGFEGFEGLVREVLELAWCLASAAVSEAAQLLTIKLFN
ncbi:MAG: hypothetical protein ACI8TP_005072 [Acidimicrobiales bacterium]|jgi:hypothetical protein